MCITADSFRRIVVKVFESIKGKYIRCLKIWLQNHISPILEKSLENVTVTFEFPDPFQIEVKPTEATVNENATLKFSCIDINGKFDRLYWFKDGVNVTYTHYPRFKVETIRHDKSSKVVLSIVKAFLEDSGEYTCVASGSPRGVINKTAHLTVKGEHPCFGCLICTSCRGEGVVIIIIIIINLTCIALFLKNSIALNSRKDKSKM